MKPNHLGRVENSYFWNPKKNDHAIGKVFCPKTLGGCTVTS